MNNMVNMDEIMCELRNNVKQRSYSREAVNFETVCSKKEEAEDLDFFEELMEQDVRYLSRNYFVDYDQPVKGRSSRIKKFIKRIYQFHQRPMWDAQNCFNLKVESVAVQFRNFVLAQMAQNNQMLKSLEELRELCREQEDRITQLEMKLSEEKV